MDRYFGKKNMLFDDDLTLVFKVRACFNSSLIAFCLIFFNEIILSEEERLFFERKNIVKTIITYRDFNIIRDSYFLSNNYFIIFLSFLYI
jgi:hypothetical protein